jgi:hypothetical protein
MQPSPSVATGPPTVTVTMLGTSGSGKSTFMLGMYAILAGGVRGYFAHASHDDHLQLMDQWDLLYDDGRLPPPTPEIPRNYRFHFLQGLDPLLGIDWMDYRGGALSDRANSSDTAELIRRMAASDCVYLVLDGTVVAEWVRGMFEAAAAARDLPDLGRLRRKLRVEDMTGMLLRSITVRRDEGKRPPALVVVITKMDTLTTISKLPQHETMGLIRDYLSDLLPAAHAEGVTTLLQPVQLGDFGTERTDVVDKDSVAPRDLEKPFIFTFLEFLTNRIADESQFLDAVTKRHAETDLELSAVKRRFGAQFFQRQRLDQLNKQQQRLVADAERTRAALQQMQGKAERLRADLREAWIIRNGCPPGQPGGS